MIHHLKIYPEHFSAVCTGVKRAELRKNDRDFKVGDTLHLMETPKGSCSPTGEYINAVVSHIADVGEWLPGYVMLSIERESGYAAPQLPQPAMVPTFDEWCAATDNKPLGWVKDAMREAYDGCRAAMLQGAEPREHVRREHAEWSQSTFGSVGPVGPLKHLSKEALEAVAEPEDLSEWADMQFLLWDAQRRAGITDEQITQAMIEKLAINKARQWPEPKDGEPRLHIKAAPQQEVK